MTRRRLRIPCILALAGLPLLGACGGGEPAPAPPAAGAAAVQTAPAPAGYGGGRVRVPAGEEARAEVVVHMADSQFEPAQIAVDEGRTIRWSNADPVAHTATASSGASFDSPTIEPGGEFRWTATRSGRVSYLCRFHPGMTATIVVR